MLAPQFSLRRLMAWTAGVALFAWIASCAVRGNSFATAISWTLGMAALSLITFAWMFLFASLLAGGFRRLSNIGRADDDQSPFAEHRPPPQMVRPEEPV